jgi:CRP/FNR family transcriptional regulator
MFLPCPDCPIRKKPLFRPFSGEELAFVTAAKVGQHDYAAREPIVAPGTAEVTYTLLSGWAFRAKLLPGGQRQILDFLLPGDLMGLQSPLTGRVRHAITALTNVTVCELSPSAVRAVFNRHAELSAALVQMLLLDNDRADRRLLLLGRQRPTQRLAYLMLDLHERLALREFAANGRCEFPLTYEHMADALGLSRAQLARSLAELRERGWANTQNGTLALSAPDAMAAFCAYEPAPAQPKRALL